MALSAQPTPLHVLPLAFRAFVASEDGQLLAVQRFFDRKVNPTWSVPGGRYPFKNNVATTLRQNIKREFGLSVTSLARLPTVVALGRENLSQLMQTDCSYKVMLDDLETEFKWVSPNEWPLDDCCELSRALLPTVQNFIRSNPHRFLLTPKL